MTAARPDLDDLARQLEESGNYRVLRRLRLEERVEAGDGTRTRTGMFLDVESTGLDVHSSEIIELAITPFEYDSQARIVSVGQSLHQFNEPADPIPSEITAITGLTDEMVAGHRLDIAAIEAFVERADILLAHNAAFDRPFVERLAPIFAAKPWACTMCDVAWKSEGIEGRSSHRQTAGGQRLWLVEALRSCSVSVATREPEPWCRRIRRMPRRRWLPGRPG